MTTIRRNRYGEPRESWVGTQCGNVIRELVARFAYTLPFRFKSGSAAGRSIIKGNQMELVIAFLSMAFGFDHEDCIAWADEQMESLKCPPRDDGEIMRKIREDKIRERATNDSN